MNELEKYIEGLKLNWFDAKEWKDWAFGAVDFAFSSKQITSEEYDKIIEKYDI